MVLVLIVIPFAALILSVYFPGVILFTTIDKFFAITGLGLTDSCGAFCKKLMETTLL